MNWRKVEDDSFDFTLDLAAAPGCTLLGDKVAPLVFASKSKLGASAGGAWVLDSNGSFEAEGRAIPRGACDETTLADPILACASALSGLS